MKHTMNLVALIFLIVLSSCSGSDEKAKETVAEAAGDAGLTINSNDNRTGHFSFGDKAVTGEIQTQYFGDKEKGNFSVLCQHNESNDPSNNNFELLQITFVNENDALTNPALKIYDGAILPMTEPEPGIVAVTLSGSGNGLDEQFTGSEKSAGTITVKNRIIEIKHLSLFTSEGDKKVINATLPF